MRGIIEVWKGFGATADVHADAILWTSCRLQAYYLTSKKAKMSFWSIPCVTIEDVVLVGYLAVRSKMSQ